MDDFDISQYRMYCVVRQDIEIPTGNTTTRLRYVLCPFNPFVGTNEQNVCQGK